MTWYTTFSQDDIAPLLKEFNKAYPDIKVTTLRLSADDIPPRIITEQKGQKYVADVVSGDSPQIAQLLQAKALEPYSPPDGSTLPDGLDLPHGYEGVIYALSTTIAYNPEAVKKQGLPKPTGVETFTNPAWKGKFSMDPSALNWYDSLIRSMGHDKALDLVKRLGANSPVFVESHIEALTNVQAGEPDGTLAAYGNKSAEYKEDTPERLDFINTNPLPASLNLVDIVKGAPHPAAARLFEDWIVSHDGQQAIVDTTRRTSLRPDVKNDPSIWNVDKWKPAWGEPMLTPKEYNAELSEYDAAIGAQR